MLFPLPGSYSLPTAPLLKGPLLGEAIPPHPALLQYFLHYALLTTHQGILVALI